MEAIKDTIKAEMATRGVSELSAGVFKVRWVSVQSSRFDSAAFKATHQDLYEQYSKSTQSMRFSVA